VNEPLRTLSKYCQVRSIHQYTSNNLKGVQLMQPSIMHFTKRVSLVSIAIITAATLSACASNQQRRNYADAPAPQQSQQGYRSVEVGYVEDVQIVGGGNAGTTGGGAVVGGIVGGVAGHQMGGSARGRDAATVVGVVAGALIGNEIERNQRGNSAQYSVVRVRLENGQVLSMEQAANVDVRSGDRVRVYDRRGIARY
jgi:outer membrane lipoprotein SlyB